MCVTCCFQMSDVKLHFVRFIPGCQDGLTVQAHVHCCSPVHSMHFRAEGWEFTYIYMCICKRIYNCAGCRL